MSFCQEVASVQVVKVQWFRACCVSCLRSVTNTVKRRTIDEMVSIYSLQNLIVTEHAERGMLALSLLPHVEG